MANRRFGGGLGPKLGYGGGGGGYQGNKMNPWQGGNAPGNVGNTNLLSSMSAPQAQLALAISSLLQPQNNPPSLLSLNTGGSSYDQDDFGSHGRFDRGRDIRRPEPYKNQGRFGNSGSWRDTSTRPLGGPPIRPGGGGGGGRPFLKAKFNRDRNIQPNRPRVARVNDSKKEKEEKKNDTLDDSRDEDEGKKRDWKREKKDIDKTAESVDLTVEDEEQAKNGEDKKARDKSGKYKGVPTSLLHCFVCSKSMWDGESFQNHLKGKAHQQMIDSLGQSFQVTVNILRENMRLVEEKKLIELDRMNRSSRYRGRQGHEPKSHCNMCDLEFLGKIVGHRKTDGHQRLKKFLHPNCNHCAKEFPSRMEWLDHRLTPEHLLKVTEVLETKEGGADGALIEEEAVEMNNDPILDESILAESEDPVLELSGDLKDLHNRIPAFKPNRPVAQENLQPSSGFYCDLCIRFMPTEDLSQEHLKSERHYIKFVEAAKSKFKKQNEEWERAVKRRKEEEAEEKAAKKLKKDEDDEESKDPDKYDPEDPSQEDDSLLDNTTLDEEMAEVDSLIKTEASVNGDESEKETTQVNESSPRARRAAPAPAGGNVKNGAGPKSKARRGGK